MRPNPSAARSARGCHPSGRALRPGKERALILDHAGNTWTHGLVDAPREWTLAAQAQAQKNAPGANRPPLRGMWCNKCA
jgi:hypothetical protein